jgi:hypothetical protein
LRKLIAASRTSGCCRIPSGNPSARPSGRARREQVIFVGYPEGIDPQQLAGAPYRLLNRNRILLDHQSSISAAGGFAAR